VSVRYERDTAGTGRLMRSPEMAALMEEVARRGESIARSLAAAHVVTGDYEASFRVTVTRHGGVLAADYGASYGDRAEARLVNDSPHAVLAEWYDGLHILARTAGYLEGGRGG